jgi:hypothetical protein
VRPGLPEPLGAVEGVPDGEADADALGDGDVSASTEADAPMAKIAAVPSPRQTGLYTDRNTPQHLRRIAVDPSGPLAPQHTAPLPRGGDPEPCEHG